MGDFAIISEGYTDQVVLKNILLGLLSTEDDEPVVNFEHPPYNEAARRGDYPPGGWSLVTQYFAQGRYKQALQTNTFLVVHIDTDVSEEYGVAKGAKGGELGLIADVVAMFRKHIDDALWQAHGERFIFAVAVHEIECWLLPPLFDTQKARMAKINDCFDLANDRLRQSKRLPLRDKKGRKDGKAYDQASAGYRKRAEVLRLCDSNVSLGVFVREVERRKIRLPTGPGGASGP